MTDNVVPLRPASDPVPEHIEPHIATNLTEDQMLVMVENIRVRRLRAFEDYARTEEARKKETRFAIASKLDKKLSQFHKAFEKLDADCAKLEKIAFDLRALRIQYTDGM